MQQRIHAFVHVNLKFSFVSCVMVLFWTPLGSIAYGGTYTYSRLRNAHIRTCGQADTLSEKNKDKERQKNNELEIELERRIKHEQIRVNGKDLSDHLCCFLFVCLLVLVLVLCLYRSIFVLSLKHAVAPLYMLTHHANIHSQCRKMTTAKSFKR